MGSIEIDDQATLADIRQQLNIEMDDEDLPESYRFRFAGAPCARAQESQRLAAACLPMVVLYTRAVAEHRKYVSATSSSSSPAAPPPVTPHQPHLPGIAARTPTPSSTRTTGRTRGAATVGAGAAAAAAAAAASVGATNTTTTTSATFMFTNTRVREGDHEADTFSPRLCLVSSHSSRGRTGVLPRALVAQSHGLVAPTRALVALIALNSPRQSPSCHRKKTRSAGDRHSPRLPPLTHSRPPDDDEISLSFSDSDSGETSATSRRSKLSKRSRRSNKSGRSKRSKRRRKERKRKKKRKKHHSEEEEEKKEEEKAPEQPQPIEARPAEPEPRPPTPVEMVPYPLPTIVSVVQGSADMWCAKPIGDFVTGDDILKIGALVAVGGGRGARTGVGEGGVGDGQPRLAL